MPNEYPAGVLAVAVRTRGARREVLVQLSHWLWVRLFLLPWGERRRQSIEIWAASECARGWGSVLVIFVPIGKDWPSYPLDNSI